MWVQPGHIMKFTFSCAIILLHTRTSFTCEDNQAALCNNHVACDFTAKHTVQPPFYTRVYMAQPHCATSFTRQCNQAAFRNNHATCQCRKPRCVGLLCCEPVYSWLDCVCVCCGIGGVVSVLRQKAYVMNFECTAFHVYSLYVGRFICR